MKLLLCFVLLFVAVRAEYELEIGPEEPDDDQAIVIPRPVEVDDNDKDECMKKFWECKRSLKGRYDCEGKLKCYEEKSKCYKARKANKPNMPTKSPEKMACKKTFEGCLANAGDMCMTKLECYKQKTMCYRKLSWGRRRHHHGRRHHHHHRKPHHHHRRHKNPKMKKCWMAKKSCFAKANHSCAEELNCLWEARKCMKDAWPKHSTTAQPPTTKPDMDDDDKDDDDDDDDDNDDMIEKRRRRWDPKVIAKCEAKFEQCINSSEDCVKQRSCFYEMKKCIMGEHRRWPSPCPKMMKCKTEYRNCSSEANTCEEKLECKLEMHRCMQSVRPTGTPPPTTDGPAEYGRRRHHWDPKRREKCAQELEKCLNETTTCSKKMECFWAMKKCIMSHGRPHEDIRHMIKHKMTKIFTHIHGALTKFLGQANDMFQNKNKGSWVKRPWVKKPWVKKPWGKKPRGQKPWGKKPWGEKRWGGLKRKMKSQFEQTKRRMEDMKRKFKIPSWDNRHPWSG